MSAVIVTAIAGLGTARRTGIDEQLAQEAGGDLQVGCTCHNPEQSDQVIAILEGLPSNFALDPEEVYNLTVRIGGNRVEGEDGSLHGGFNLHVSGGTLSTPDGATDVQVTDLGDATHTATGVDQVAWNLTWTPPSETAEAVLFRLTVNSVNGNLAQDPGDQWARAWYLSAGEDQVALGEEAAPLHIETLGVNWLAYWVGIVSFAFMIVILILYYFVFRYAETSNATDHRDRKKK